VLMVKLQKNGISRNSGATKCSRAPIFRYGPNRDSRERKEDRSSGGGEGSGSNGKGRYVTCPKGSHRRIDW
jgi:hypothetical protein